MVSLIDTNVLIRFIAADVEALHLESVAIMKRLRKGELQAVILSEVIMETLFVLNRQYKEPLNEIVESLKIILLFSGVVNQDKYVLITALDMMVDQKIDYVDALICVKSNLEGYARISFDRDVTHKCLRR